MTLSTPRLALVAVTALLTATTTLAGCGDDGRDGAAGSSSPTDALVVSAATSLKKAVTAYDATLAPTKVRASFAGSDALASQIRAGVRPDVFASANTKLPEALYREGLVERPTVFATNELVLAVPAGDDGVASLDDLGKQDVRIAIGAEGVPVGDYTRTVLDRLPQRRSKAILGNVRTEEPDVGGVVGKLTQGAVDAGFVYASDVKGAGGALRAITLPADLEPTVEYGVAIVKGGENPAGARRFVDGLLSGAGRTALREGGFGDPPAS